MLSPIRVAMLAALAVCTAGVSDVTEGRLIQPSALELEAFKLRRAAADVEDLPAKIQSYFAGSGFPHAGRTLQQKIDEADAFLATQLPKIGAVGVGTAIVYHDQVVYAKGYGLRRYNDSTTRVTTDNLFQIGSVSKTFIALGVGLLVDDGKIQWTDPVKKHMPWLKLFDKYAEDHVRVGDLLSMNSGLGRSQDLPMFAGKFNSARELIVGLQYLEPEFALRETPAYANTNYEILGQLIEDVSGETWPAFLQDRIWTPLGMNHTFAAVEDVPEDLQATALNAGHLVCESNVRGPFAMLKNPETTLSPGYKYVAAGSIVSSAADMAKLLRLVLNKGSVDGVKLFQSPSTIAEMITGKNLAMNELLANNGATLPLLGYEFMPDGNTLSAGYGFDIVAPVLWGHAYLDKGGDTFVHHTTTGYAPNDALGFVLLTNGEGSTTALTDQLRSYVMGIFLDVPKPVLDFQFAKWQASMPPRMPPIPGAPVCGFLFWENPPRVALSAAQSDAFVGVYEATSSVEYFPLATISRAPNDKDAYVIQVARLNFTVFCVGALNSSMVFLSESGASMAMSAVIVTPDDARPGNFILDLGQTYRKNK